MTGWQIRKTMIAVAALALLLAIGRGLGGWWACLDRQDQLIFTRAIVAALLQALVICTFGAVANIGRSRRPFLCLGLAFMGLLMWILFEC